MAQLEIPQIRGLIVAIGVACLLGACASGGFSGGLGSQSERRAEALADNGRFADAASIYIGLASGASGVERDRLTLLAAQQWLDAGDGRRAETAMSEVATPRDPELLWLWNLNRAALFLWNGDPDGALNLLEPMSAQSLPIERRIRVQALRGDAWFQKDDPLRAIALYTELEQWLNQPQLVARNRERLWAGLLVSNPSVLQSAVAISNDAVTRGWLSLGALAASTGQQGIGWNNGVVRWRDANSSHPGNSVLGDLVVTDQGVFDYPRRIALLLPLSGRNGAAGRAVQNGFLGAYYGASLGLDEPQQVQVYDVARDGSAAAAYARATEEGADFVVGPLLRRQVNEMAGQSVLPVPVLTLNYAPQRRQTPLGMYQFALSPEDEAAAAARRAVLDGRSHAVALVPNNDWGRRLLSTFSSELTAQGGQLLEHRFYEPTDQDFSFEIRNLMGLALSRQRYERLRANLGGKIEFDPRRREDAEFIFLAAAAPVGRLIKSQLKFHFSGDVPVYATSRIYAMDGRSDSDLNGVMFADTPWIIAPPSWISNLPALYAEYWPSERRLGRLHAMGYDAYLLVGELFSAQERALSVEGATGRLFMDQDGRIHRDLPWAEFRGGQPVFVPEARANGDAEWPGTFPDALEGDPLSANPLR